jgi:hypothetical protein
MFEEQILLRYSLPNKESKENDCDLCKNKETIWCSGGHYICEDCCHTTCNHEYKGKFCGVNLCLMHTYCESFCKPHVDMFNSPFSLTIEEYDSIKERVKNV